MVGEERLPVPNARRVVPHLFEVGHVRAKLLGTVEQLPVCFRNRPVEHCLRRLAPLVSRPDLTHLVVVTRDPARGDDDGVAPRFERPRVVRAVATDDLAAFFGDVIDPVIEVKLKPPGLFVCSEALDQR